MAFSSSSSSSPPPEGFHRRHPRYPGEDTTPTSKQEIWGWYAYGIAAEVFAVCAVGALDLYLSLEKHMLTSISLQAPSCRSPWNSWPRNVASCSRATSRV